MSYRVFSKKGCGTCNSVKSILRSKGVDFTEIDVTTEAGLYLAQKLGITAAGTVVDANDRIIPIKDIVSGQVQRATCAM